MTRCLLMNCAKAKRSIVGFLPALERYDGPYFRSVRHFLKTTPQNHTELKVLVLSAEYGLISSDAPIVNYDRRMTHERAEELRPLVLNILQQQLSHEHTAELFVLLSADYHAAIRGFEAVVPLGTKIVRANGAQGIRAAQLKRWLYGTVPDAPYLKTVTRRAKRSGHQPVTIRGHTVSATPLEVMDHARNALRDGLGRPHNFHKWYVPVDGSKVGPKWLLSQLTGLPVSVFVSSEARAILERLGIHVHQLKDRA